MATKEGHELLGSREREQNQEEEGEGHPRGQREKSEEHLKSWQLFP
jgi:hypothetical protein